MSLFEVVFFCVAVELAVIWVLRERTHLLRRTKLERLLYVCGLGTLLTQPLALMLTKDLTPAAGYWAASFAGLGLVLAIELPLYRFLGRLGWRKATIFAGCANAASFLVVLALHYFERR